MTTRNRFDPVQVLDFCDLVIQSIAVAFEPDCIHNVQTQLQSTVGIEESNTLESESPITIVHVIFTRLNVSQDNLSFFLKKKTETK